MNAKSAIRNKTWAELNVGDAASIERRCSPEDLAMDVEAARTKGIASLVAGHANVLIVPNLEAGNILVKELSFVARAEAAGLVLGAKAPVILTSRADNDRARLASCALAQLYEYWRREGRAFGDQETVAKAAE